MTTNQQIKHIVSTCLFGHIAYDVITIIVSYVATDTDEMVDYIIDWAAGYPNITQHLIIRRNWTSNQCRMFMKYGHLDYIDLHIYTNSHIGISKLGAESADFIVNYQPRYLLPIMIRRHNLAFFGSDYIGIFIFELMVNFNEIYNLLKNDTI